MFRFILFCAIMVTVTRLIVSDPDGSTGVVELSGMDEVERERFSGRRMDTHQSVPSYALCPVATLCSWLPFASPFCGPKISFPYPTLSPHGRMKVVRGFSSPSPYPCLSFLPKQNVSYLCTTVGPSFFAVILYFFFRFLSSHHARFVSEYI